MRFLSSSVLVACVGCSALIDPDPARLGRDAGSIVLIDGGADAGPGPRDGGDPPRDGGGPSDAGPRDAGVDARPGCAPPGARCEGEVRVECVGGMERRQDCAMVDGFCEAGACRPRVCAPGSVACSEDGTSVLTCDARGASETSASCSFGCDPSTSSCAASACAGLPAVVVGGSVRVDLCAETDDDTYVPGAGCMAMVRASAGDRTYVLDIATRTRVLIDLRDVDSSAAIDTVVYIRRACSDEATQLACGDDVPCMSSDIMSGCSGGVQVRQSRIMIDLEPGTYFIVVDAFVYDMFRCGVVELRVFPR